MNSPLVEVDGLVKHFPVRDAGRRGSGTVYAVNGVSFTVHRGETLGLVGESGCGKTTTALCLLRLTEPTAGSVHFDGADVTRADADGLFRFRRRAQVVFQDPFSSLNPRMTVGEIVREPLEIHRVGTDASRRARVGELLARVGLSPEHRGRYPHQFSGGQRQRIGIARALALDPAFIVCDEPVSALDVSIQAQVVNLLASLQRELGLSYLFIAHDLAVVRHVSHRIGVMYLGYLVELGSRDAIYARPRHPYTVALLSAVPVPDPAVEAHRRRIVLAGDPPAPTDPPRGCPFRGRCWKAQDICADVNPALTDDGTGHTVACHFPEG